MATFKVINSDFVDNMSIVTVQRGNKFYVGMAKCHPDEKKKSLLLGGEIAESRCHLKYYLDRLQQKKEEYRIVSNFIRRCESCKAYDMDSPNRKILYRQLNAIYKERKYWAGRAESVQERIKELCSLPEKFNKLKSNRNKREEQLKKLKAMLVKKK